MKGAKIVKCVPLSVPVIRRGLGRKHRMVRASVLVNGRECKGRSILNFFDLSLFFLRGGLNDVCKQGTARRCTLNSESTRGGKTLVSCRLIWISNAGTTHLLDPLEPGSHHQRPSFR